MAFFEGSFFLVATFGSLTFLFDLPAAQAAQRRVAVRAADRFEAQDEDFFDRVRSGYRLRRAAQPSRFALLDASQTPAEVWTQLMRVLEARGW